MNIKIRTGSNISTVLQSTLSYEQAFTELVKNSLQNGASNISIELLSDRAVITDNGIGFDDSIDENGMSGFDKYFVFGNSYDSSGGAGPRLGHMGIGGKIANDKLSDNDGIDWSVETRNKNGKILLVRYKPTVVEYLDDYHPELFELDASSINTESGTVIRINNLDKPIKTNGWDVGSVESELKSFFGSMVAQGRSDLDISVNGKSLKFDYTFSAYSLPEVVKSFDYIVGDDIRTATVKFNLSLLTNDYQRKNSPMDSVQIVSSVKVHNLELSRSSIIDSIYEDISEASSKVVKPQAAVLKLFKNMRGFINCDELSTSLDHQGMPAKTVSHHELRDDHPITIPFYNTVYSVVIDMLRGYLLLNESAKENKFEVLAFNVSRFMTDLLSVDDALLSEVGLSVPVESATARMTHVGLSEELAGDLVKKHIDNQVQNVRHGKKRRRRQQLNDKYNPTGSVNIPDNLKPGSGMYVEDENGELRQVYNSHALDYEIVDFGSNKKDIMSSVETDPHFKILINSGNHKFTNIQEAGDNFALALHIAENIIKEIAPYTENGNDPTAVEKRISSFYENSYNKLRGLDLFSI
jgi:hypothetical protein